MAAGTSKRILHSSRRFGKTSLSFRGKNQGIELAIPAAESVSERWGMLVSQALT
jgi:hypothetical protein